MRTSISPSSRVIGDYVAAVIGEIGEYQQLSVNSPNSTLLSTGITVTLGGGGAPVMALPLTAGEWDVSAVVDFLFSATTSYTSLQTGLSLVSATLPTQNPAAVNGVTLSPDPLISFFTPAAVPGGGNISLVIPPNRVVIPTNYNPATIFLVAQAVFTVSTLAALATLRARRVQ